MADVQPCTGNTSNVVFTNNHTSSNYLDIVCGLDQLKCINWIFKIHNIFDWNYTKDRRKKFRKLCTWTPRALSYVLSSVLNPKHIEMALFFSRSYHFNPQIIFCILSVNTQNIFVDKCLYFEVMFLVKINVFCWIVKAHTTYTHTALSSPYSVPLTSWHNVWAGSTLTESQLRILKVHLGWLRLLICRGWGLRTLMRKRAWNQQKRKL